MTTYLKKLPTSIAQQQSAESSKHELRNDMGRSCVSTQQRFGRRDGAASNQNDRYGRATDPNRTINIDKTYYSETLVVEAMQSSIQRSSGTRS